MLFFFISCTFSPSNLTLSTATRNWYVQFNANLSWFFGTLCVNIPKQSLKAMTIKHLLVSDLLGRICIKFLPLRTLVYVLLNTFNYPNLVHGYARMNEIIIQSLPSSWNTGFLESIIKDTVPILFQNIWSVVDRLRRNPQW